MTEPTPLDPYYEALDHYEEEFHHDVEESLCEEACLPDAGPTPVKVCIDPGHGGKDPGAIGHVPWKLREADFTWSTSVLLHHMLAKYGYEVLMTRRQGQGALLLDRARKANEWGADLFVSVHANAHESPVASGIEVLHYGSLDGERVAKSILEGIFQEEPRFINRGLKIRKGLSVLRNTRMPAVLVELPFVSNVFDLENMAESAVQVSLARGIFRGLISLSDPPFV